MLLVIALVYLLVVAVLIPLSVFTVECLAALLPAPTPVLPPESIRPRTTVLIAAHNEEDDLPATLESVLPQLKSGDRTLVVADNCTDATAATARALGADVIERHDPTRLGKGYALARGVQYLAQNDPPEVVIVVDADCEVHPGTVDHLVHCACSEQRPVQGKNYLLPPPEPGASELLGNLAFMFKNVVRPRGLSRLGMPCLLYGTGMAFPWRIIRDAPLATGRTAQDILLAVDLAIAGTPPVYCEQAVVTSDALTNRSSARRQRIAWEHGHLDHIVRHFPRLLLRAIRMGRLDLLVLALELSVPPLSLLVVLWLVATASAALLWLVSGTWFPILAMLVSGGLFGSVIVASWARLELVDFSLLLLLFMPFYVLRKVPIYAGFLVKRQVNWASRLFVASSKDTHSENHDLARAGTYLARPVVVPTLNALPEVTLMGATLHAMTEAQCVHLVLDALNDSTGGWIITMNLVHLRHYVQDPAHAALYQEADLVVADGMPLVWASHLQGTPLPERVTGSNLIWSLSAGAATANRSIFLLGGAPDTAKRTASILRDSFPGLQVVGTFCPPMGFEKNKDEVGRIARTLSEAEPDIVYVAMSSPKQDEFIKQLHHRLPKAWWLGVGISFSLVAGEIVRAPLWIQKAGLEWLHRLVQEPRRLAKRYLVEGLPFATVLFGRALLAGIFRKR